MKRLAFILLSFVLLVSQFHLTIGTHFCGGEAVISKLIMTDANLDCGMATMDESCAIAEEQDVSFTNPPCCENHYQTIETTDNFINDFQATNIHNDFVAALVYTIINLDEITPSTALFYADYAPPPLEKDIQILFQTFII